MSLVKPNFKSLLPKTEFKRFEGIDFIGDESINRINIDNLTLLPKDTPTNLLSHLAFLFDVRVELLSETEQRELIEVSYELHRHIGTSYALERALSIILPENGDDSKRVIEWYETKGELAPYTFKLNLDRMDKRGAKFLIEYIHSFKNTRSWLKQISDGRCKGRLQLDHSLYDDAIISDIEGVSVDGVRICFRETTVQGLTALYSTEKERTLTRDSSHYYIPNRYDHMLLDSKPLIINKYIEENHYKKVDKEFYYIPNRYDHLLLDSKPFTIDKYIDKYYQFKHIIMQKSWLGQWEESWSDRYSISMGKTTMRNKVLSIEVDNNKSSIETSLKMIELTIDIFKSNHYFKDFHLTRNWLSGWDDTWDSKYITSIAKTTTLDKLSSTMVSSKKRVTTVNLKTIKFTTDISKNSHYLKGLHLTRNWLSGWDDTWDSKYTIQGEK